MGGLGLAFVTHFSARQKRHIDRDSAVGQHSHRSPATEGLIVWMGGQYENLLPTINHQTAARLRLRNQNAFTRLISGDLLFWHETFSRLSNNQAAGLFCLANRQSCAKTVRSDWGEPHRN